MDLDLLREIAADDVAGAVPRVLLQTTPAAGADFTITVPGESTWQVVALSARFVTSNAVANRGPGLLVTDGTNTIGEWPTGVVLTASLTTRITWSASGGSLMTSIISGALTVPIPPLILPGGYVVRTGTSLIDTADQWDRIVLTVVELQTGDKAYEAHLLEKIVDRLEALQPNSLAPF